MTFLEVMLQKYMACDVLAPSFLPQHIHPPRDSRVTSQSLMLLFCLETSMTASYLLAKINFPLLADRAFKTFSDLDPIHFSSLAIHHSPDPILLPNRLTYNSWLSLYPLASSHSPLALQIWPDLPLLSCTSGWLRPLLHCSLSTPFPQP